MSINRPAAQARLQAALQAWRKVASDRRSAKDPVLRTALSMAGSYRRSDGVYVEDRTLDALADGFDLMAQLWTELEDLTRECDVAAHFVEARALPGRVEFKVPREDGLAPLTLKMDASEAASLGEMLIKASSRAKG